MIQPNRGMSLLLVGLTCVLGTSCSAEPTSKRPAPQAQPVASGEPAPVVSPEPKQESDEVQLQAAVKQGGELEKQDKFEEAIPHYEKAVAVASRVYGQDHPKTAPLLTSLGRLYEALERYSDAEPMLRQSFQIREVELGPDDPRIVRRLIELGSECQSMGQYQMAEHLFLRALRLQEQAPEVQGKAQQTVVQYENIDGALSNLGHTYLALGQIRKSQECFFNAEEHMHNTKVIKDNRPDWTYSFKGSLSVVWSNYNSAEAYRARGQYKEAERYYRLSLAAADDKARLYGEVPRLGFDSLWELASLLQETGRPDEAKSLYNSFIDKYDLRDTLRDYDLYNVLSGLGSLYQQTGEYSKADAAYKRGVEIAAKPRVIHSKHTGQFVKMLVGQASLYQEMGRFDDAETAYRRALKILENRRLPVDHELARSLNGLGLFFQTIGQYPQAEPLFQRSLRIYEAKYGPDHLVVANGLSDLAGFYRVKREFEKAEPLLKRAARIRETQLGVDNPETALGLIELARLYEAMGQFDLAESLCRRSLPILTAKLPPVHPKLAGALNDLAGIYLEKGKFDQAEPLYKSSLRIREAQFGPDHPAVAQSLNDLAVLLLAKGQPDQAEPLLKRALKIREHKFGMDHPDVAQSLDIMASMYRATGRYAEAEPLLKRGLEIREAKLGPDHPDVAQSLDGQAALLICQGRWQEAAAAADRARRILRRHAGRVLPVLAESEQLTFLAARDEPSFHAALSISRVRSSDPTLAALSAGWVLNGKAVAQQALAQRALLARDTHDPAATQIAAQLSAVRDRMSALTLAVPTPKQLAARRQALAKLDAQERELAKQLGQATGRPNRDDPWVGLDEIRKALPPDAVLIEIARFRVLDYYAKVANAQWKAPRYVAWIIPPKGRGDVRVIDLGEAGSIDDSVALTRKTIQPAAATLRTQGEPEAERQVRKPLDSLAQWILKPLLPHIGRAKQWIISPDAGLWLVPWAALPLDGERYAIEEHSIRYVVSGRDLVEPGTTGPAGPSLVMADPDYDLGPEQAHTEAKRLRESETLAPDESASTQRGKSGLLALGRAPRLPGTAAEAEAIIPSLQRYTGTEPAVYLDQRALEGVFKAAHGPRVVVLSTHGFFLEDQPAPGADRNGGKSRSSRARGPAPNNPLLQCGLLVAGANRRRTARQSNDEDGVLTGLEIVGTDLRGTELVVLSACETGLGQVRNGEGVAGLRQAFQLAGAQSVVATLWQVPDKESARLMAGFFDNLAAGKDKAEALRAAQLAAIQSRRKQYGAAHPFFWAAYTLTGKGFTTKNHGQGEK
jgi:CHAT domain-containing protein/Tfp pilus assembly protein PilF